MTTTLPTLRASTAARLARGEKIRTRIVGILGECRAVLSSPEATNPANAAQVATFAARLATLESVIAEEVSADWLCLTADGVTRDADDVIGALMGDARDAAPLLNAFDIKARSFASVRTFTV
jgi:hypothetical protein